MIQLTNLTVGYPKNTIASNLNATLTPGKLTCLVGRNGVGKSTLLRTLAGFQPQLAGSITIHNEELSSLTRKQLARKVSVVLTARPQMQNMSAREIIALGRSPYTDMWGTLREEDRRIVEDSIAKVGVENLADRDLDTLSDGECQKVMIAKALAQQTPVILLDEPTAFLDYPSKVDTMRLMKTIARGNGSSSAVDQQRATLLSTHDMEMALRLADELWVMTRDHHLVCGTPQQLETLLTDEGLKMTI